MTLETYVCGEHIEILLDDCAFIEKKKFVVADLEGRMIYDSWVAEKHGISARSGWVLTNVIVGSGYFPKTLMEQ